QRDLQTSVGVTNLYADTAPNLLRTTDNAAVTSKTIVDHQDSLDAVLLNLIGLADTTGAVLKENENGLSTALDLLRPTAELLNEYNPALYCLVEGVAGAIPRANEIFGGTGPWVTLNASFMPGGTPYTYPKDLPKVNATGGPHCEGILDRKPGSHANYLVTDTTEGRVYTPELSTHLNGPRVFQLLFAGLPGVGNP
ncbi:MCE family protein, partial [Nocardia nova]